MSERSTTTPLLRVRDLTVNFGSKRHAISAVAGISFDIFEGETLGLVGESGCGKSTTGKALMRIVEPTSGTVELEGIDITKQKGKALRNLRTRLQMIFQDPISSLNPRRRVKDIVAEPLDCWKTVTGDERERLVQDLLSKVGIDPHVYGNRYARQFSGGQCQRISIARSLAMRPKLLICDEMVSALDVSVQAQILNLLEDLKTEYGLTLLFIAHDLAVVKNVSDRVAVMYLGKICEIGPSDTLYESPEHPYTKFLLGAALEADVDSPVHGDVLDGEPPSPLNPPSGCRFRTRCPNATARCASEEPLLREAAPGHQVACHYPLSTLASR
ncbi:MAG TPA: ATP-binding cassette domain-containing protein [Acidimicrobiales bacterium]|nr:MAG: peptide ABC transporter ATP-binding protein [Actinobacteria bacterium 21-64-8]HQU00220.1 ATP-binding cassette domain-containing protein [Acidimicrobiales bacterium]